MTLRTWFITSPRRSAGWLARPLGAAVLLGGLLLGLSATEQEARAQKGGKTPPPPPPNAVLPNVRYALTWLTGGPGWESLLPQDINKWGDVAGTAYDTGPGASIPPSAFAHSSLTGTINLNDVKVVRNGIPVPADWWDLNAAEPTLAAGWRASFAGGINDWGDIVGHATNANTNLPIRAFVLEDALGDAPRFLLLPTVGAGNHDGRRINNHGDAVGHSGTGVVRYQRLGDAWPVYNAVLEFAGAGVTGINDDGVIIARGWTSKGNTVTYTSYRQTVSGTVPAVFPGHDFMAISNGGNARICGTRDGTDGRIAGVIRLPVLGTANDAQLIYAGATYNYAWSINDDGDLCFEKYQNTPRGALFYDAINPSTGIRYGVNGDGILPLDQLVVTQDPGWLDPTRILGITNRNATGLGHICGAAATINGFLLTPYVPAP